MKKVELKNKIVEHKDEIRDVAAWVASIPVAIVTDAKIDELLQPESLLGKVGVEILKATVQTTAKVVAEISFEQIDKVGVKIKNKISEKKKGIHYAEYEVKEVQVAKDSPIAQAF